MSTAENNNMAVDLTDLIPDLATEISPPGSDFFPSATEDQLLTNLRNGFWEAFNDGLFTTFTETDGLITATDGGDDMSRDQQQLIIFYAGFRILRASLRSNATMTRSKAGPVEFETQNSANVMRDLLKELQEKRNILLRRLSDLGNIPTGYIDAVIARTDSINYGTGWFTMGSWSYPAR